MTGNLRHWHGTPSELADPPECCQHVFHKHATESNREWNRQLDEAVHAERVRVINSALDVIEAYGASAASVLDGRDAQLAQRMTKHAADAVRKTGCICPRIETTSFGGPQSWTCGWDARCGMHEVQDRSSGPGISDTPTGQ